MNKSILTFLLTYSSEKKDVEKKGVETLYMGPTTITNYQIDDTKYHCVLHEILMHFDA